jgi:hypothetical protein
MIKFNLSLSPTNEVPVSTNSTGSGGTISGGIVFDTASNILQVAVGYGSAAGFTDLTGPAIGMHIHGPAGPGTNADVLVSLVPFNFTAANPTNGGVIFGAVQVPTNDTAALLAGKTYVNIHTPEYPNGEIRGQLIPGPVATTSNQPPIVVCPTGGTVDCGSSNNLVTLVTDAEGDALTVVWTINGMVVETNTLPARGPGVPAMSSLSQELPVGTNVIDVSVTDTGSNTVSCMTQLVVQDTNSPVITSASAEPSVLWPPNHKLVEVTVHARVADKCSVTTYKITKVTSNEPVGSQPDWIITGNHTVKLRAERLGSGHGRVYTITIQAQAAGNLSATKTVTVTVPHSQGEGGEGGDDDHDHGNGNANGNGNGHGHH